MTEFNYIVTSFSETVCEAKVEQVRKLGMKEALMIPLYVKKLKITNIEKSVASRKIKSVRSPYDT